MRQDIIISRKDFHDLRSSVGSILMAMDILDDGLKEKDPWFTMVRSNANKILVLLTPREVIHAG